MWSSGMHSWLDRWVGLCVSLFIASAAIYGAVWLIEAVWVPLVVIVGVAGAFVVVTTCLGWPWSLVGWQP
jgi:Na+/glutamate symporter